ncbi:hypothetical protein H312_03237 [Anncaliia algerae PRA339]|uniref:Condensin complex subunit 2 n=1 Tax=Anncaliia algerae PRA339 TaxID=1288291 RepID=A0A059EWE7_9MICR|nr:hypothetical protein H312_03237 [Anncaliia algerae PRA339]
MTIKNTIDSWLKAAAENKITNKNTWNAPLIDHFTNLEEFTEKKGINFQKASTSLEGCVKVYSTRADDVTDDTLKLLDSLNVEENDVKQKRQKTRSNTLETNINNITMKENNTYQVIEPFFYFFKEDVSLLRNCNISSKGMLLLFDKYENDNYLNLLSYKIEENLYEEKSISPTLNEVDPSIADKIYVEEIEEIKDIEPEYHPEVAEEIEQDYQEASKPVKIEDNTFGYVKGWAGPTFWKIKHQRNENIVKIPKERKKAKIDFSENVDFSILFKKANNILNPTDILNRRKNRWMMPEDHKFVKNDLYKFLVKEGSFFSLSKKNDSFIQEDFMPNVPLPPITYDNDTPEEVQVDFKNVKNVSLSKKLHLKFTRTQKRVDIGLLQNKIFGFIKERKKTSLKEIYNSLPMIYNEKDFKDISLQYCMLSLLFSAQENNLTLHKENEDELKVVYV